MKGRLIAAALLGAACSGAPPANGLPPERENAIRTEVAGALEVIPIDLARGGPEAWLDHLDATDFAMASDGVLKFKSFRAAQQNLRAFGPTVARMDLEWGEVRVDVLTADLARFGASYDELIVDRAGEEQRFVGYVTGSMRRTESGWRITRLHWSLPMPPPAETP